MSNSLIAMTVVFALLAWLNFHLGFRRPVPLLAWLPQGAFLVFMFLLIPVCLFALWNQHRASDRLSATGIVPHPTFEHAVGIATGRGESPIWLFELTATPDEVLEFYRAEDNHNGWQLVSDSPPMLIFGDGDGDGARRLTIIAGDSSRSRSVAFQVTTRDND